MELLSSEKINIYGFNASLYPKGTEILGIIRRQFHMKEPGYPEIGNSAHFFILDSQMKLVTFHDIHDKTKRHHHKNFTRDIEDFRWIDETSGIAVTLDTNPCWKTEISYIELDHEKHIQRVLPLRFGDVPTQNEKNWIPLEKNGSELLCLYSMNPVTLVKANLDTGKCESIQQETIQHFQGAVHNGAFFRHGDSYIFTVRVKEKYMYKQSYWVKLGPDFKIQKISRAFRFTDSDEYRIQSSPPEYRPGPYEMCMTLFQTDTKTVTAVVSVGDNDIFLQKYSLQSILDFINES
jgi:hypothetical protein